jgi:hypothetical protein
MTHQAAVAREFGEQMAPAVTARIELEVAQAVGCLDEHRAAARNSMRDPHAIGGPAIGEELSEWHADRHAPRDRSERIAHKARQFRIVPGARRNTPGASAGQRVVHAVFLSR